jgi:hypothetical protein
MRALDGDVAMMDDRFENLSLLAPEKLAKTIAHPPDGIADVQILRRVQEVSKGLPHRG